MIHICEFNVCGPSHHTLNCGFMRAIQICFEDEEIAFHLKHGYGQSYKEAFAQYGIDASRIKIYEHIILGKYDTIFNFISTSIVSSFIFLKMKIKKDNFIYFLTTTAAQDFFIKKMMKYVCGPQVKCLIVLHAILGVLAGETFSSSPVVPMPARTESILTRLRRGGYRELPKKLFNFTKGILIHFFNENKYFKFVLTFEKNYNVDVLPNLRFLALSEWIPDEAAKFGCDKSFNLHGIDMPVIIEPLTETVSNKYLKLAVFGSGDPRMLQRLVEKLKDRAINSDYEIRLIGACNVPFEERSHVTNISPEELTRKRMLELLPDIDMFLILYNKNRYLLSCSLSILEAHIHAKPVLHLTTPCVDYFNKNDRPIGVRCEDLDDMALRLECMINNYSEFVKELDCYRANMKIQRNELELENRIDKLKQKIAWS